MNTNENQNSWDEAFALDIPSVDKIFIVIFDIYDQLRNIRKKKNPFSDDELQNILKRLESYLVKSSQIEQEHVKSIDFEDTDLYISNFQKLISRVDDFIIDYSSNNPMILQELIDYLKKWLFAQLMQARKIYL